MAYLGVRTLKGDAPVYVTLPEKFKREYATLWRSLFVGDLETIEVCRPAIAHATMLAQIKLLEYCGVMGYTQRQRELFCKLDFDEAASR